MRRTKTVMVAMLVVASMFELSSSAAVATNGLPVLLRGARASGLSTTPTKHGIVVPVQITGADLCYVELAFANDNAFLVSISYSVSPPGHGQPDACAAGILRRLYKVYFWKLCGNQNVVRLSQDQSKQRGVRHGRQQWQQHHVYSTAELI